MGDRGYSGFYCVAIVKIPIIGQRFVLYICRLCHKLHCQRRFAAGGRSRQLYARWRSTVAMVEKEDSAVKDRDRIDAVGRRLHIHHRACLRGKGCSALVGRIGGYSSNKTIIVIGKEKLVLILGGPGET